MKTTYGLKTHANVDEDGFIKTYDYTAGNVHDLNVFETLLTGNEKEVYAIMRYLKIKVLEIVCLSEHTEISH